ncbi:uncharacterized protein LOC143291118 [Babylonia areolata]|uniref:uncharacterized protein LOC143291118 n=1 Tax=Babylonia areolata TaxID=304850 RepID=UPI003FD3304A
MDQQMCSDSMEPDQKAGSDGSSVDRSADQSSTPAPDKLKDSSTAPVHSTPVLSSSKDRDGSHLSLLASPITSRRSGRARKKTEKGSEFDEFVKRKKNFELEDSEAGVKSLAYTSGEFDAKSSAQTPVHLSKNSNPPRRRGRPRKSDTISRDAKDPEESNSKESSAETVIDAEATMESKLEGSEVDLNSLADSSSEVTAKQSTEMSNPPRKRGRPRKSTSHDTEPHKNAEESNSKESSAETANNAEVTMESKPEGIEVDLNSLADTSSEVTAKQSIQVSNPPRKRGRPPRKRGRPRKSISPDTEPHENTEEISSKESFPEAITAEATMESKPECSEVDLNRLADTSNGVTVKQSVEMSNPPRKRGRPRKSFGHGTEPHENTEKRSSSPPTAVEEAVHRDEVMADRKTEPAAAEKDPQPVVKRKRGRPKKIKPLTDDSLEHSQELSQHKDQKEPQEEKNNGRPKRRISRKRFSFTEEEEECEEVETPRKRQRKAAGSLREDKEEESEEEEEERRKRSKNSHLDGEEDWRKQEEEEEEEAVVVKKRRGVGRPKKKKDETAVQIEKCLRCEEKMESLAAYKTHLMNIHAALYSPECPEGEQTHAAIQKILKKIKYVLCPMCRKPFRFAQYFRHHLEWCGREMEKAICRVCGHELKAMWMQQHERDHRKKEARKEEKQKVEEGKGEEGEEQDVSINRTMKRKAATASLLKMKAVSQEKEDKFHSKKNRKSKKHDGEWDANSQDEEEDEDEDVYSGEESGSDVERFTSFRYPDSRKVINRAPDYFQEHQKFLDKLPKGNLFTSLLPQHAEWSPLSESERAEYLPETRESVAVSFKRGLTRPTEPATLQWGESICDDRQGTAFVGGCVWAMEWCPLDEEVDRPEQVLAVSGSREMWDNWPLFQRGSGPGCIQFWTTSPLGRSRPEGGVSLKLAFTVAHNLLHALSMSWCPRRAYLQSPSDSADTLPRLGLLAVAGYDSNVVVYSVPTPEALESKGREGTRNDPHGPPCFKPAPCLTLLCSNPKLAGACLSVAWQKGDNCDFIVGGYAKGFVQLWHLSSTSPLVRRSPDTLSAVRFFYAHYGVMSVDWSWLNPTWFVTGSLENQIKLWDMKDTRTPLLVNPDILLYEKGPTRAVSYNCSSIDAVMFADDQRDVISGAVYGINLSNGLPRGAEARRLHTTLARHAACVWSISCSPWHGMVASGDSTGLMYLSSCSPLLFPYVKGITRVRKGVPVFTTTCTQKKQGEGTCPDEEEEATSDDVITSAEGLQVTFSDQNMEVEKDFIKRDREDSYTRTHVGSFKAEDIYVAHLNPNKGSSRWVACGTRAGFLRILHLPCMTRQSETATAYFAQKTPVT